MFQPKRVDVFSPGGCPQGLNTFRFLKHALIIDGCCSWWYHNGAVTVRLGINYYNLGMKGLALKDVSLRSLCSLPNAPCCALPVFESCAATLVLDFENVFGAFFGRSTLIG